MTRCLVSIPNRFAIESLRALLSGSGYLFNCSFLSDVENSSSSSFEGGSGFSFACNLISQSVLST